jgi:nucleoid-associated protein YgaU
MIKIIIFTSLVFVVVGTAFGMRDEVTEVLSKAYDALTNAEFEDAVKGLEDCKANNNLDEVEQIAVESLLARAKECLINYQTMVMLLSSSVIESSVQAGYGKGYIHIVQPGETLWDIAGYYYNGNHNLWHSIYDKNTDIIRENPQFIGGQTVVWIYPGQELKIPMPPSSEQK